MSTERAARRCEVASPAFVDMLAPYRDPVHRHRVGNAIAALQQ